MTIPKNRMDRCSLYLNALPALKPIILEGHTLFRPRYIIGKGVSSVAV